jgi:DNA-directed RNA polymerase subunit N (RpoN/RPB10)
MEPVSEYRQTLRDVGIAKVTAHRWQKSASQPVTLVSDYAATLDDVGINRMAARRRQQSIFGKIPS